MTTHESLLLHEKLIYENFSSLDLESLEKEMMFKEEWEWVPAIEFVTESEKGKDIKYYKPNFTRLDIKNVRYQPLKKYLFSSKKLIELFSNENILNIYLFKIWGDVIEHKDPDGSYLGYPEKKYNTLLMPLSVPTKNFYTNINGEYVDLQTGKFIELKVSEVPHSWKYKFSGTYFNVLHVDYKCQGA